MRIGAQILSLLKGFKDTIAVMKIVFAFILTIFDIDVW